jgi:hypothetical protein
VQSGCAVPAHRLDLQPKHSTTGLFRVVLARFDMGFLSCPPTSRRTYRRRSSAVVLAAAAQTAAPAFRHHPRPRLPPMPAGHRRGIDEDDGGRKKEGRLVVRVLRSRFYMVMMFGELVE